MSGVVENPEDLVSAVDATIAILRSSSLVAKLAQDRVYGGSVPEYQAKNLVDAMLVVNEAGSGLERPGSNDYVPMTVGRVDVLAYAPSQYDAERLHLAAHHALKTFRSGVVDRILIRWANRNSGPFSQRDGGTGWPVVLGTYIVLFADERVN